MQVLVFMIVFGFTALAGLQIDIPCYNLSADDCAVMQSASSNSAENLNSFTQNVSVDFSITGLETLGMGGDMAFTINGSGTYMKSDGTLPFSMAMNMEMTMSGTDGEVTSPFNFVIVDDVFYIEESSGTWSGRKVDDLLGTANLTALGLSPETQQTNTDPTEALQALGIEPETITELANLSGFFNYERLEDDNALTPFSFSADFGVLFAAPEFQDMVESLLQTAGESNPDLAMMQMILPSLLENTQASVVLTRHVSTEDNFIHIVQLDLDAEIDINTVMAAMGNTSDTELDPVVIHLSTTAELSDINTIPEITTPEGAEIIEQ